MIIALRKIRESKGISAETLGDLVGVSKHSIWGYETGRTQPDPETLCKLADALDVSLDLLVRGKEKDRLKGRSLVDLVEMYRELSDEQLDYFILALQAAKADKRFQAHLRQGEKETQ